MKVRLNESRVVGTAEGGSFGQSKGDIIDVEEAEGLRMIAAGQCSLVDEEPAAKRTAEAPAAKAAKR